MTRLGKRTLAPFALLAVMAASLSACGGGGAGEGSSDPRDY